MNPQDQQYPLAYCLNVHPTTSVDQLLANLQQARLVSEKVCGGTGAPLGVGLWIPANLLPQIRQAGPLSQLQATLGEYQLVPFTMNGFPFGNFHQPVVKHDVYLPDWTQAKRLDYTLGLFELQHELLAEGLEGSISTLPLGWPQKSWLPADGQWQLRHAPSEFDSFAELCAKQLLQVARQLEQLETKSGRLCSLCLEPEPGCIFSQSEDLCHFFERWILTSTAQSSLARRYLRVCHDVCHAAVVGETQAQAWNNYERLGLSVGKVQISSAPRMDLAKLPVEQHHQCLAQLSSFAEPKYLHQTYDGARLYDDLGAALAQVGFSGKHGDPLPQADANWVIHFHVPIFLSRIGLLQTTQDAIGQCCDLLRDRPGARHIEVETYAWNVLPAEYRTESLADGIAQEIAWLRAALSGVSN